MGKGGSVNAEQRQELREEHADATYWDNPGCTCCEYTEVPGCKAGCYEYPCDVIRVLDEFDDLAERVESLTTGTARMGDQLEAVLAIHSNGLGFCDHCLIPYPCPTALAAGATK